MNRRLFLQAISNIQVAGYVHEARSNQSAIGTVGQGRVDRAVRYDGGCYGNVGECIGLRAEIVEFTNGWKLRASGDSLQIVAPDGSVRDSW